MQININCSLELTNEVQSEVVKLLPKAINDVLLANDSKELYKMIETAVRSSIKQSINDLLQGKEFREFLRDKVWNCLNVSTDNNCVHEEDMIDKSSNELPETFIVDISKDL